MLSPGETHAVQLTNRTTISEETPTSSPASSTMLRVLCVDDFRDAADTLGTLLKIYGCDVRVCYDGPAALQIAPLFRPDVCVLDLSMPGMTGDELARRLRAMPLRPMPRLVAVTALGDREARERTRMAGFDAHLVKPVDPDALANMVADVVIMRGWDIPAN
jgi:two-component system, OmpR family, response regulator